MGNVSIKTSPTGVTLEQILDNWLDSVWMDIARTARGSGISGSWMMEMVSDRIRDTIFKLVTAMIPEQLLMWERRQRQLLMNITEV